MIKIPRLDLKTVKNEYLKFNMEYCDNSFLGVSKKHKCVDMDGFLFDVSLASLRVNKKPDVFHKGNKYTLENIKHWLLLNNKQIQIVDNKYKDSSSKINWRCNICGKNFSRSWNEIQRGYVCSKCNREEYSVEKIKEILSNKNNNIEIELSNYVGLKQVVKYMCLNSECNHSWNNTLERIAYHSVFCPKCVGGGNLGGYNFTMAERNKEKWLAIQTKIYIIEMFNNDFTEQFYKIGITNRNLSDRFRKNLPYKFDKLVEYKTNLYNAIHLEHQLHLSHRKYEYIPKIKFDGYTECFHSLDINAVAKIESQL